MKYSSSSIDSIGAPGVIRLNTWQHVVATVSSSGIGRLYVNGLRVAEKPLAPPPVLTRVYNYVGAESISSGFPVGGRLDEVAVYRSALPVDRVRAHYIASGRSLPVRVSGISYQDAVAVDGPRAYLRFNEDAGDTVAWDMAGDLVGDPNNAYAYNGAAAGTMTRGVTTDVLKGEAGNRAYTFPATNGYVALPGGFDNFSGGLSFEAWIKPDPADSYNAIVALTSGTAADNLYFRRYFNNTLQLYVGSELLTTANNAIVPGQWSYVAATWQPGTNVGRIYVNGVQVASKVFTNAPTNVYRARNLVGRDVGGGTGLDFTGDMDEVAIYTYPLSVEQVQAHYIAAGYSPLSAAQYLTRHDCAKCTPWARQLGDPVDALEGHYLDEQTDLVLAGRGVTLNLTRAYHSGEPTDRGFGLGWSYPYAMDVLFDSPTSTSVVVRGADGKRDRYTWSGSAYVAPAGVDSTLVKNGDGTWTLIGRNQTVATFDGSGRLTSLKDKGGNATTLTHTTTSVTISEPAGRSITLTRGASGGADANRFVTMTEGGAGGRAVSYAYTAGLLTSVTDVRGQTTTMTYDASRRLQEILRPGGVRKVKNTYDASGRVTEQRDDADNLVTYAYNSVAKTTTRTDATGKAVTFTADASRRVPVAADGLGNTTTITYDASNKPTCVTDALGNKSAQQFDAKGNVTASIDALNTDAVCGLKAGGVQRTYTYGPRNELLTSTDELGHTTTYTYDADLNVLTVTDALLNTTTYTYTTITIGTATPLKVRATETDALGRVTAYTYTGLGQVASVTRASGTPLAATSTFEYDTKGRLVKTTEPGGVASCREYDAGDLLTATVANCVPGGGATSSQNVRTEYGYDEQGRPAWTRAPLGEITRTFYTTTGQVSQTVAGCAVAGVPSTGACDAFNPATPHLNRTTTYGYDTAGRRVTVTDTLGVVTKTEYDLAGRAWRTTRNYVLGGPVDATTNVSSTVEYRADGRVLATVDPLGRRTEYRYDAAGRRTDTIQNYVDGDPTTGTAETDRVTKTIYDAAGNVTATIANHYDGAWNPAEPDRDVKSVTAYDELNRPSQTIGNYVDGVVGPGEIDTDRSTSQLYDAVGNVTASIDVIGRTTVTAYDALNRTTETVQNCTNGAGTYLTSGCASGHGAGGDENIRTSTSYTARGQVEISTDALGRRTKQVYDALGRVTQTIANESGTTAPANVTVSTLTYDAASRVTDRTDANSKHWLSTYNSAGWLTRSTDPTGVYTDYAYDGLGRTVRTTDVFGRSAVTTFDPLGRGLQAITNYQDGVYTPGVDGPDQDLITASEYDAAGRRLASVTPAGLRTTYAYDLLNRLTSVTENAGGSVAPANVTTTYAYDQRGLLTGITDANAHTRTRSYNAAGWQTGATDALGRQVVTEYDRAGRRTTVYDLRPASVAYTYDNLDRVIGVTAAGITPIAWAYDLAGRRTSMVDASGSTAYTYDGLDRLSSATHSISGTVSQSFDLAGRRTSLATSTGLPTQNFLYDDAGRLTEVQRLGLTQASATFDAGGRLASISRANGLTTTNSYDNANRLTRLQTLQGGTPWSDFQYSVGRGGLVTAASESIGASSRTLTYTYDGLERLSQAVTTPGDTYAYTYDAVGNRLTVTVSGLLIENRSYDNADQVIGWSYDATGNLLNDGVRTYSHDALKRLASTTSAGVTTTFLYTGDNALASRTVSGVTTTYTLDPASGLTERLGSTTSSSTTWYSRGWGQELTRDTAGTLTYLLADRLGSIRAEADSAGTLTSSLNFDPYGTPQGTAPVDFGFTGEPQAEAGSLVHLRARWYAPGSGAFVSRDAYQGEAASPRSQQPYGYALQAPTTWTDPSGFCPEPPASWGRTVCIAWFIQDQEMYIPDKSAPLYTVLGDGRGFSSRTSPDQSRAYMWISLDRKGDYKLGLSPSHYRWTEYNYDNVRCYPTASGHMICDQPEKREYVREFPVSPTNSVSVTTYDGGPDWWGTKIEYDMTISGPVEGLGGPRLNGTLWVTVDDQCDTLEVAVHGYRDGFPWLEAYYWDGHGSVTTLAQRPAINANPYDLYAIEKGNRDLNPAYWVANRANGGREPVADRF